MTGKKVLIVYGTRYGSAEGISGKMADLLREQGAEAERKIHLRVY